MHIAMTSWGHARCYFLASEFDRFTDAGTQGNWARFVNHSCEPICTTQKWSINGGIRVNFFAKDDIKACEGIIMDYQSVQFEVSEEKSFSGTSSRSGIVGATSKQSHDKVPQKSKKIRKWLNVA